jgi:exopolysaccharide biosynthesis polyprenyl glycosylphosphotransferase
MRSREPFIEEAETRRQSAPNVLEELHALSHPGRGDVIPRRGWLVRRVLLLADLIGIAGAYFLAEAVWGGSAGSLSPLAEYVALLGTLPVWVVGAKVYGLYDKDEERTDHSTGDEVFTLLHFITLGTWVLFVGGWLTGIINPDFPKLVTFWISALAFVGVGRAVARALCRRTASYVQNTIVVGAGETGQLVAAKLMKHPEYGLHLVGFVDNPRPDDDAPPHPIVGIPAELPALVQEFDVERVIIAFPNEGHQETVDLVYSLKELDVQIDLVPSLHQFVSPNIGIHAIEGVPLIGLPPFRLATSSFLLKRSLDLAFSAVGLLFLLPLFLLVAVAIKLDSRGPVLFKQVRRGARDSVFSLYKFRTMVADADERKSELEDLNKHVREGGDPRMFKIENDPRVTRVGRILRRYMLDELPQFINVLKGDMSLVGPRPLILEEDRHVTAWARKRLDLKPGMTGLWQVLGRQAISFEEMVKLDYLYVTTWSLGGDLRLLFQTIPIVLKGEGGTF